MEAGITGIKQTLFGKLDFSAILSNPDFKEDSTRAIIIDPLLRELGYTSETIVRSKTLSHPILKTGTTKRPITLFPDYLLKVEESFAWTLDAKAPSQNVLDADNIEQVYSYAIHREIRSVFFAICNGVDFALFRTSEPSSPELFFRIDEIDAHWDLLRRFLSPESFQKGKEIIYEKPCVINENFDYAARPLLDEIQVKKQQAKRHFGCTAYFTRQAWNVVAEYIKNFTQAGDVVLDSFGGSGVTVVEALVENRKAIHVDINPLSDFIANALIAPVKFDVLMDAFVNIKKQYRKNEPKTEAEFSEALIKYNGFKDLPLPKGSDVKNVSELFTPTQAAGLALLKNLIQKQKDKNIRLSLMLAFYNTVSVVNRTFHKTPHGGGNHFGYYYRYRIAPKPADLKAIDVFERKFMRVYKGKQELEEKARIHQKTPEEFAADAKIIQGSATDLSFLKKESVDYIYTDPPYGKKIQYLDLSTMWYAWLDLDVSDSDYEMEAIVGGERNKTKDNYNELISKSIQEMYRVLKFDRWLSFVFAHKDPEFWHLIINTCEKCGFEYIGAIPQKNGQTSFKKRQNPFTVLSGELIINFRKTRDPRSVLKANLGMDMGVIVMQTIEGIIAKNDGATLEQINDELITKGLELGFLDLLKKEYTDLNEILDKDFDYDEKTKNYHIKKGKTFGTKIDLPLRVKYYLVSFLRRMELQNKIPSFNEIVFAIMPLLKNGITPEQQTILNVLEDIALPVGDDGWKLKPQERMLFDD